MDIYIYISSPHFGRAADHKFPLPLYIYIYVLPIYLSIYLSLYLSSIYLSSIKIYFKELAHTIMEVGKS